jgi:hypothetical protein
MEMSITVTRSKRNCEYCSMNREYIKRESSLKI